MFKLAGVQFDVQLGRTAENLKRIVDYLRQTSEAGATLTIFPECSLSGYCFESLDEARTAAESIPGPSTEALAQACAKRAAYAIIGMLESEGESLFNAAVLVGPRGVIGSYRKVHLPFLGIDRYTTFGDRPFAVQQAGDVRVGMNICYDASFPEAARSLMLQGADLIALPTNWPPGAQCVAETTIRTRALENGVYFAAVNRVGTERGFEFIGQSQIADPGGKLLHCASRDREEVFYAEIDPSRARQKHVIRVPGKHEIDRVADRRPEMYGELVKPHRRPRPGRQGSTPTS